MVNELKRRNFAAEILEPFHGVVQRLNLPSCGLQKKDNCINLYGRVNFEFGDLRVILPHCFVVVEAESGPVIGNLVKYWYLIEKGLITKPVFLFHLYSQITVNNLSSQKELWYFFNEKMEKLFSENFKGFLYPYDLNNMQPSLIPAAQAFEQLLNRNKDVRQLRDVKVVKAK